MLKIVFMAVIPFLPLVGDSRQVAIGEVEWLSSEACTQPDPLQCSLEKEMRKQLRAGPVLLEPSPDFK